MASRKPKLGVSSVAGQADERSATPTSDVKNPNNSPTKGRPKSSHSQEPPAKLVNVKTRSVAVAKKPIGSAVVEFNPIPFEKLPDGTLAPKGYTMRPVVAAENYDVVSFARAMNDDFAPRVKKLFEPETKAAIEAQRTGVYTGWRLPGQKFDCQRISDTSLCFCGHLLGEHSQYSGRSVKVPCRQPGCKCQYYRWIPSRPEDVGEFWHQRRRNFDPSTWHAKCRCKHSHLEHDCTGSNRCLMKGCGCSVFSSNFLCAACDKHWEEHQTFFETEEMRKREGLPIGQAYLPFAEMPNLRNAVLTGDERDDSAYLAITNGYGAPPITSSPQGNNAVFRPAKSSGFRPVHD